MIGMLIFLPCLINSIEIDEDAMKLIEHGTTQHGALSLHDFLGHLRITHVDSK